LSAFENRTHFLWQQRPSSCCKVGKDSSTWARMLNKTRSQYHHTRHHNQPITITGQKGKAPFSKTVARAFFHVKSLYVGPPSQCIFISHKQIDKHTFINLSNTAILSNYNWRMKGHGDVESMNEEWWTKRRRVANGRWMSFAYIVGGGVVNRIGYQGRLN
jgi:hypothetical protein